jgi:TldD protein
MNHNKKSVSGIRFQKRYFFSLPSKNVVNKQESSKLHAGMSCYELGNTYIFSAKTYDHLLNTKIFLEDIAVDTETVGFFNDFSDIIPSFEYKRKRQLVINELSSYVENQYKEVKEHGFYYYFTKDKNLLFNYQKNIYQKTEQISAAVEFRTVICYHGGVYEGIDLLLDGTELIDSSWEELKRKVDLIIERRLKMTDAEIPQSGEYVIVLKSAVASGFLHESVGHLFEEDLFKQQKVFNERTFVNPHISLTDYAQTAFGKPCPLSIYIDSEGTETTDVPLVKNGQICTRMNNRRYARETDVPCTGNGRSELFFEIPLIRMRNTALAADKILVRDLTTLDNAIVAETNEAGSAEQNGEVELFIEFGYEIKKGKTIRYLRNFIIRGYALDLLNSIDGCENNFSWHTGTCNKNGYPIRVSYGSPSILLRGIIYGG